MNSSSTNSDKWKILITDDQEFIHVMIKHYLSDYQFQGKCLEYIDAFSGNEAIQKLDEHSDIAVIILDVMLEEQDTGFKMVQYIRDTLNNKLIKIIMLTGKLDIENAQNFFMKYDIDMYCPKHDLDKIFFMVTSSLRAYHSARSIYRLHEKLKKKLAIQKAAENNLKELNQQLEQMVHKKEVQLENTTSSLQEAIVYAKQLTQEVEKTNNAKSRFLANLSHEVRTPMNGVLGMLGLILESELSSKQRENILLAKHSADQMLFLISDILDFSKMEYDTIHIYNEVFKLKDIIQSALIPLELSAKEKGIKLVHDISPEIPEHLYGAPDRLFQILINLIKNAIKFSECDDVVIKARINDKRLYEELKDTHVEIIFSVIDQGLGMSKEILENIFSPFYQGHIGLSESKGGLGLGLSICKQLVDMMGGAIWAESKTGKGSTFYYILLFKKIDEKQAIAYDSKREREYQPTTVPTQSADDKMTTSFSKNNNISDTEKQNQLKIKGQSILQSIDQAIMDDNLERIGKFINQLYELASDAGERALADNTFRCKLAVRKENKEKIIQVVDIIKKELS